MAECLRNGSCSFALALLLTCDNVRRRVLHEHRAFMFCSPSSDQLLAPLVRWCSAQQLLVRNLHQQERIRSQHANAACFS